MSECGGRVGDSQRGGLVVVTSDGPEHRFVARCIGVAFPVRAILLCDPTPRRAWHRILRQNPFRFIDKALWRVYLKLVSDENVRAMALNEVLGLENLKFPPNVSLICVGQPREGLLEEVLRSLAPDVIAVYGTSIVPDAALAQARRVALNLHTGISPRYRGAGCAFWPIYNGEPEWVGATIHECTAAVDGGRIFTTCHSPPCHGDTLHHIFARTVLAGSAAYVDVIGKALSGLIEGQIQDLSSGHEYPGSARGLLSELRARQRLARMNRT